MQDKSIRVKSDAGRQGLSADILRAGQDQKKKELGASLLRTEEETPLRGKAGRARSFVRSRALPFIDRNKKMLALIFLEMDLIPSAAAANAVFGLHALTAAAVLLAAAPGYLIEYGFLSGLVKILGKFV
ncbi:MAG: hypothetical protein LVQ97_00195 [Candidatus Micrarchaeales archaeon]|jgi:hypothetical protein|nr:hypothetical protein [Candidatus Micrarchaeales archaeon]